MLAGVQCKAEEVSCGRHPFSFKTSFTLHRLALPYGERENKNCLSPPQQFLTLLCPEVRLCMYISTSITPDSMFNKMLPFLSCLPCLPSPGRLLGARGFPGSSVDKESAFSAGDLGSIPGSGRSPGEGSGNPLQCSGLENSMDRAAWRATVHEVTKSRM